MELVYTLTSLIETFMGNGSWKDNTSYSFNDSRSELTIVAQGYGDSIDYRDGKGYWEEDCMVYQGFYPFWDDETPEDLDDGVTEFRSHSYKSVIYEFTLTLPSERKRGDTYTVEEIRKMITHTEFVYENPGMGFTYYNEVDEDE